MPDSPPDNRPYSVDEILDKLRDGERSKTAREEGEIVTRPDGSQALKVKKRKRRSKQKKDEVAKRKKTIGRVKVIAFITIPVVLSLAFLLVLARYHSSGFARKLENTAREMSGGAVEFRRIHPMPTSVTARTVLVQWPDGSYLDQLQLNEVKGDLEWYSYFSGRWQGDSIRAANGMAVFSQRTGRKVPPSGSETVPEPEFGSLVCENFTAFFGKKKSGFRMTGTTAIVQDRPHGTELLLEGGECVFPGWGQYPLSRAVFTIGADRVELISFRLAQPTGGEVLFSGNFLAGEGEITLDMTASDVPFATLLGPELAGLMGGYFEEDRGTLTFDAWDYDSHQLFVAARPKSVRLAKFAFLDQIRDMFPNAAKTPELSSVCQFNLNRNGGKIELMDIDFRDSGVLGVRGKISVEGGKLSGLIEVGLPAHQNPLVSEANRLRFERACKSFDGYNWVPVNLGGTLENPTDDFATYFEETAPAPAEEISPSDAENLFDELTR